MSNNDKENNKVWNQSLDDIMSESFGKYAKYIIQDRALPDIRDGLKPVQRRILYAMNDLKIHYDKSYKKSARTVGEVIGKYHPHGDSSIYEAMVRMSQEWKNNIPLLDMQGNKGSIDGDGPAAMRYTECRLSCYGQLLLDDIQKDTVKFIPNFDDSEQEPSILPSLLPNVLINGATGIAAGYATNVPPFNVNEVLDGIIYRIKNPECHLKTIASIIKGPDFPTGGIVQGRDGIMDIFATGKGKFNIRAKIESEIIGSKKIKRLIVTEIPYETNKAVLVKSLDEIRINGELPGLKEVRDDSDKNGISIVLEIDTDKDLDIIKTFLYKKTQLQISYTANVVLIKDRKPVQCSLLEILDAYIEHANIIIIKSATFDLNKALARKEILEGLIKTISEVDKLVELIKSSASKDEAKQKISEYFELTERQSEAVVQLRLYVLTSYDTQKLKDEYDELLKFIEFNEKLVNDSFFRSQNLIEKLINFKKTIGIPRKSAIEDQIEELEIEETDIIEEINGTCIVTRDNYIKFIQDSKLDEFNLEKTKIKESDIPVDFFELNTLDTLVILTNKGKCITIPAHKIKFSKLRENGVHVNEIITINSAERTIAAFRISKTSDIDTQILVATKNSLVKRFLLSELNLSKNAKSISYINLKNDDEVSAFVVGKENKEIITITESGFAIRYLISEIPIIGRTASGVKNISLKPNDFVADSLLVNPHENFIFITSNRGAKRIHFEDINLTSRAKSGKRILSQVDSNPYIINSAFIIDGRSSVCVLTESQELFETRVSDIPISDPTTRMSSFSKIKDIILKCSNLNLNKNFVPENLENNFLTLNDSNNNEKNNQKESKNKNDKISVKNHNFNESENLLDEDSDEFQNDFIDEDEENIDDNFDYDENNQNLNNDSDAKSIEENLKDNSQENFKDDNESDDFENTSDLSEEDSNLDDDYEIEKQEDSLEENLDDKFGDEDEFDSEDNNLEYDKVNEEDLNTQEEQENLIEENLENDELDDNEYSEDNDLEYEEYNDDLLEKDSKDNELNDNENLEDDENIKSFDNDNLLDDLEDNHDENELDEDLENDYQKNENDLDEDLEDNYQEDENELDNNSENDYQDDDYNEENEDDEEDLESSLNDIENSE